MMIQKIFTAGILLLLSKLAKAEDKLPALVICAGVACHRIETVAVVKPDKPYDRQVKPQTESGRFFQVTVINIVHRAPQIAGLNKCKRVNTCRWRKRKRVAEFGSELLVHSPCIKVCIFIKDAEGAVIIAAQRNSG